MINQDKLIARMKQADIEKLSKECGITITFLKLVMRTKIELKQDTLAKIEKGLSGL